MNNRATKTEVADAGDTHIRVAIVEDDPVMARMVSRGLKSAHCMCTCMSTGSALISRLASETYDVVVLDWNLPDISGLEVLERIRSTDAMDAGVIFLTGRTSEADVVLALDSGADDYVVKPFRMNELASRVRSAARRKRRTASPQGTIAVPPYRFDPGSRRAWFGEDPVALTGMEFNLALFMFQNANQVVSRRHIVEAVWGDARKAIGRSLDVHISRLRKKLAIAPENGWQVMAERGFGFKLQQIDTSPAETPNR